MRTLQSPEAFRSMGFWNEATQQAIHDTNVAIGGVGGAGYLIGIELAHMGVQNFSIADPEDFDDVNSNRVLGATEDTYGKNKALVFADEIHRINGDANVKVFTEGINADNVAVFMHGADVVFDATELSMPELGTMTCRQARKIGAPVVNVEYVAHGAQGTSFDPNSKWTFEKVMGLPEDAPLDEIAEMTIPVDRFLSYLPSYVDLRTMTEVQNGSPLPSNMIGASLAANIATAETLKHIRQRVGEKTIAPVFAPRVRWMDAYSGNSGTSSHPRTRFYWNLIKAGVNNKLGRNEEASYSVEERAARGDVSSMIPDNA